MKLDVFLEMVQCYYVFTFFNIPTGVFFEDGDHHGVLWSFFKQRQFGWRCLSELLFKCTC